MIGSIEGMLKYNARCGQVPGMHKYLLGNPLFPILIPFMETWNMVVVFTLKAMSELPSIVNMKMLIASRRTSLAQAQRRARRLPSPGSRQ